MKKKVAAIVTEYRKWSHADVIVGKIIEGFLYDNKDGPNLELVSMVVDQKHPKDMSEGLAKKYGFRLCKTVEEALTLGTPTLAVEGVLSIGEHGNYSTNERGQKLYPRRRFFEAITDVFAKYKKAVPVFNDKHLAATWEDAKWMYDRARELFVPFLAGSSIPLTYRKPALKLDKDCNLVEAVQIGYGPFEGYGFHAIEGLQCMAERRKGGESGVKSVQCLQGADMWKAMDEGRWSKALLEAAMERVPAHAKGDVRELTSNPKTGKEAAVFLVEYRDGFKGAVAMLNGWVYEGEGGAFTFAGKLKGKEKPVATQYYMQQPDPYAHFIYLVKAIESMVQTGHPPYPVERTLLTTGVLDAVMVSKSEKQRKVDTPHLDIKYMPTEWGYAPEPVVKPVKREFP
jgi:hypothetical protein